MRRYMRRRLSPVNGRGARSATFEALSRKYAYVGLNHRSFGCYGLAPSPHTCLPIPFTVVFSVLKYAC